MKTVNIEDDNLSLSLILQMVEDGEEVIVFEFGRPIAKFSPIVETTPARIPGVDLGKIVIKDDFDDPLPEFEY